MRLIEPLTDVERAVFIAEARTYLRTPFRHAGRSRRGIDCLGLIVCGLAAAGRAIGDRRDYGRDPVRDNLRGEMVSRFGAPLPPQSMQPGDIALMRWHEEGGVKLFNHVGILTHYPLGELALLHALWANRKVVEHRLAGPWPRRIVEVFRP